MKIGDIVRRKCSMDNKPIGPYMRVMAIQDERVYADTIGQDEPNVILLKKNCHVCNVHQLVVSEEILDKLKSGRITKLQHISCKTWYAVYRKKPDLIMFRSPKRKEKSLYTLEDVKMASFLGRHTCIRLDMGYKVE